MRICTDCQCVNDNEAPNCRQCGSNLAVTGLPLPDIDDDERRTMFRDRQDDDPLPPTVRLARVPLVGSDTSNEAGAEPPVEPRPAKDPAEQTTVVLPVPPPAPLIESSDPDADAVTPRSTALGNDWSPDARPKLVVVRGLRIDCEYPLFEGPNFIGRLADKPVDVNLEDQEPADKVWASRRHAVITFADGRLVIEDLNSLNGTFVNRTRVPPAQQRPLQPGDLIQIGTVQMKVTT